MVERGFTGFLCRTLVVSVSAYSAVAAADAAKSGFNVRASVASIATLERRDTPEFVRLTSTDRASGRVTVQAALTVSTNAEGYLLSVWPAADWFDTVSVAGPGVSGDFPAEGGAIVRRTGGPMRETVPVDFTFRFRPDQALPAELPWPLELEVAPL